MTGSIESECDDNIEGLWEKNGKILDEEDPSKSIEIVNEGLLDAIVELPPEIDVNNA